MTEKSQREEEYRNRKMEATRRVGDSVTDEIAAEFGVSKEDASAALGKILQDKLGADAVDLRRIHADDGMEGLANLESEGIGLAGLVPGGG